MKICMLCKNFIYVLNGMAGRRIAVKNMGEDIFKLSYDHFAVLGYDESYYFSSYFIASGKSRNFKILEYEECELLQ